MTEAVSPLEVSGASRRISIRTIQTASVFLLLVVLCLISSLQTDTFFTWTNLVDNLFTSASYIGVMACGMTLVMIAGGFDLSVASMVAVCSVITVLVLKGLAGYGAWVAIPVAVIATTAAGTILGAINGVFVSYVGVNPFVVTLSTMLVFRGLALVITHGGQSIEVPMTLGSLFREVYWGRVPLFGSEYRLTIPILVFLGVFVVFHVFLRYTRFGHYVYAVGGNETASWLTGINTARIKAITYTLSGLTCALAAVVYTGMSNTAQAASYQGIEMVVIAAVIVGGTPLGGGSGNLWCTLNGLLLLSVIENLLTQFGIAEEYRNIVRGTLILMVVAIDVSVRRANMRKRWRSKTC
ncbi:MAG: ABC transporter permease [Candidatus Hydrogenedentes bacterium]|nr:ABC transporter permease [Candidatus Hydrogenedentota bacterium]